jgi:hypothetical protein
MLAVEFARFLGLPLTVRANITDVIEAVCGVAVDARVSVVCVDEIHNLQLATRNGAEVSDTLKYLRCRSPPNGRAWSPRSKKRCACTATSPAP